MSNADRFARLLETQAVASDLKSRTIRGGAFAMGSEGVGFLLRLGSIILLARLLVPEQFGLIAMVTAITGIAERFKDLGLSVATVQRKEITHGEVSTLFWVNTGAGIGIALVIAALAVPIASFYGEPRLVAISIALSTCFVLNGMTVQHLALQRRLMRFGQIAVVQTGSLAASVVIAIVVALNGYGYWALVAREVAYNLLLLVGTWFCVRWIPGRPTRQAHLKSMLVFGGDLTALGLIWSFVTSNLDQILIGKMFGPTPLGLYRQGINLVLQPITHLSHPIGMVAETVLSRLQDASERYRRYYVNLLGGLASLTMPLAAFLAVYSEEIVRVALGPKWVDAADYIRIFALAAAVRPSLFTAGSVMITCGNSRRSLWWGIFHSIGLAAFLVVGTHWGPTGVAYAHVASSYLLLPPLLYWGLMGSPITIGDFASAVQKPLLATLAMAAILYAVKRAEFFDGALPTLALGAVLALPVYLGAWMLLPGGRVALKQAVTYMLSMVRKREA